MTHGCWLKVLAATLALGIVPAAAQPIENELVLITPVEFNGGVRSYFDRPVTSVYDEALAQRRYERVNTRYRTEIEVPGIRAERQAGHARPPSWLVRHQTRMYRQAL